jgi:uncharacterized protein
MSRIIFFVVLAFVVYWLLKSYRKQSHGEDRASDDASGQAEDTVRCVHCGVNLPKRESIVAGGKNYCSEAHRRLHADKSE